MFIINIRRLIYNVNQFRTSYLILGRTGNQRYHRAKGVAVNTV
jgi:hypothetical protein